ncbi:hypothetical protein SAMN05421690_10184 [Nitrosomonas sp. Nm51]|nr:hypothetical protein SAMN05421690_10184 [Nitrosomonas sp. Nm51]
MGPQDIPDTGRHSFLSVPVSGSIVQCFNTERIEAYILNAIYPKPHCVLSRIDQTAYLLFPYIHRIAIRVISYIRFFDCIGKNRRFAVNCTRLSTRHSTLSIKCDFSSGILFSGFYDQVAACTDHESAETSRVLLVVLNSLFITITFVAAKA